MLNGSGPYGYEAYDAAAQANPAGNRVRVEDALSYLDQVKTQFANEPEVYTQFLDIMKDFKSQAIDTPGVISRVSQLFHGRPGLIMGFNTFLPPGFEVRVEEGRIIILEPSGNTQEIFPDGVEYEDEEMYEEDGELDATPAAYNYEGEPMYQQESEPTPNQFNSALQYVNKIKNRFADRPEIYKHFLDILHHYNQSPVFTSHDDEAIMDLQLSKDVIMRRVSALFEGEPDLLEGFRVFLPDLEGMQITEDRHRQAYYEEPEYYSSSEASEGEDDYSADIIKDKETLMKESRKRRKVRREDIEDKVDTRIREWRQDCNLEKFIHSMTDRDLGLFDRISSNLDRGEFANIMRQMNLYACNVLSSSELMAAIKDSIGVKHAEVVEEIAELMGCNENKVDEDDESLDDKQIPIRRTLNTRREGDQIIRDIDDKTIGHLGVSYRKIRKDGPVKCSGRNNICEQVLNDIWTSYPSWSSEDSGSVSSKKSCYDEFLYRTEDERFELDIVLEVNKYAIESLEMLSKKMSSMSPLDQQQFRLDERLGATSASVMTRAIRRIYGEHSSKIIEGLRESPYTAVNTILDRLHAKEREWREAQTSMNKAWREQIEKQMLRSLDHQTANVRAADLKMTKAKTLIHQIEQLFDTRQQLPTDVDQGPHMMLVYPEKRRIFRDVNDIIIHYVKRQTNIQKEEKKIMKIILRKIVMEWFTQDKEDMSDDEEEELELERKRHRREKKECNYSRSQDEDLYNYYLDDNVFDATIDMTPRSYFLAQRRRRYRLFFGGDSLYLFLRMHQMIASRLGRLCSAHEQLVRDYREQRETALKLEQKDPQNSTLLTFEKNWGELGVAMRSIRNIKRAPYGFYDDALSSIKGFLDGQTDSQSYEEQMRLMFPTEACQVFAIDKMVQLLVRQLTALASENDECKAVRLYLQNRFREPPHCNTESPALDKAEKEYREKVEEKLQSQNCFEVHIVDDVAPRMTINLIDTEGTEAEDEEEERAAAVPGTSAETAAVGISAEEPIEEAHMETGGSKIRRNSSNLPRGCKTFLNRNLVHREGHILTHVSMSVFNENVAVAPPHAQGGLIRKQPIRHDIKMENLERSNRIRRQRNRINMRRDDRPSILDADTTMTEVANPNYPFLTFTKYVWNS